MNKLLNTTLTSIAILLAIAFYTLTERKILSYIHMRKGPNKTGFIGILQPISDALKLFNKLNIKPLKTNSLLSSSSPSIILLLALLMFCILPSQHVTLSDNQFSMLAFIFISSTTIYPLLTISWSSNSKYSNLGMIRNTAQMISYEVNLFLTLLTVILLIHSYNLSLFKNPQHLLWFLFGLLPITLMWMTICLSETNRSPFDFAEGESELVSGFNTEYMGGSFAMIFLAEYAIMIIFSMITCLLFLYSSTLLKMLFTPMIASILLWIRGTLPRYRFDLLMHLNWKIFLPLILAFTSLLALMNLHMF